MEAGSKLEADVSDLYRFALLLTGDGARAASVLLDTLASVAGELSQIRNDHHRTLWFVAQVRERCLRAPGPEPEAGGGQACELDAEQRELVDRFAGLEEPGRSALALFYLDFLSVREIAALLKMDVAEASDHFAEGRSRLRDLFNKR